MMQDDLYRRDQILRAAAAESMARIRRQDRASALNNTLRAVSKQAERAGRVSVQSESQTGTTLITSREQLENLLERST